LGLCHEKQKGDYNSEGQKIWSDAGDGVWKFFRIEKDLVVKKVIDLRYAQIWILLY